MHPDNLKKGFTLAEVLIALALLGVVAAFTIPKILNSNANQDRALFKEALATLSDVNYQARLANISVNELASFYFSKINALQTCDSDSKAQGYWTAAMDDTAAPSADSQEPGLVLKNGVAITGFSSCCDNQNSWTGKANTVIIDVNGPKTPNKIG